MDSTKKTIIIFDTNSLMINEGKGFTYSSFEFNLVFDDIKKIIKTYNLNEKIALAVPRLCIEELLNKKKYFYDVTSTSLKSRFYPFSKLDGANLALPSLKQDYEKFITETKENYVTGQEILVIDYPPDNCFQNILSRAIEKNEPFIESNKHSDYGFKDVVIWESILNFKTIRILKK